MKNITPFLLFAPGCLFRPDVIEPAAPATEIAKETANPVTLVQRERQIEADTVSVQIRCPTEALSKCEEAAEIALNEVQRLVDLSNVWNTRGDVAKLNENAGKEPVEITADTHRLLTSAQIVSAASGGAFDVTIGSISGLWGIDGIDVPEEDVLAERLQYVDWTQIALTPKTAKLNREGMSLILDGLVGGDAADSALSLVPMEWDALVNIDGDLAARGEWQVQIPVDAAHGGGNVSMWVKDTVLVASGVDANGTLDGAIDPRTGKPSPGGKWAVAAHKQGAIADALATTLLVTGPETPVVDQLGAWVLVMTDHGWVEVGGRTASVQSWSLQGTRQTQ